MALINMKSKPEREEMPGESTDMRVELQITDMAIGQTDNARNEGRAEALYGAPV